MFGGYDSVWIWIAALAIYAVEMVLRCFPSYYEAWAARSSSKRTSSRTSLSIKRLFGGTHKSTVPVIIFWTLPNLLFIWLYKQGIFDWGIMVLLSDLLLCVRHDLHLFFCPFQTWLMKNKCCNTCRIYNWDYIMMFTPLLMVDNPPRASSPQFFCCCSAGGELFHTPQRFYEHTNCALSCANCKGEAVPPQKAAAQLP